MLVGIDLDGVCYPFAEIMTQYAAWNLQKELPEATTWDFFEKWGVNSKDFVMLMREGVLDGVVFWRGEPIPGTVEALTRIGRQHEIVIVTNRSVPGAEQECRWATEAWLAQHRIPHTGLVITADKTLLGLDVLLDDAPQNIEAARRVNERAIYFTQPWNAHDEGERVHSWNEFAEALGC